MLSFFTNLFKNPKHTKMPVRNKARLGIETLEAREVPQAVPAPCFPGQQIHYKGIEGVYYNPLDVVKFRIPAGTTKDD